MITAVDTNVLIDILEPDPRFGQASAAELRGCLATGAVIACDVVWAEVTGWFEDEASVSAALSKLGIGFAPTDETAARHAGVAWRSYRGRGGPRTRVVADLLVGAHATSSAERLLTRDRGFFRTYFPKLLVLDPAG